MARIKVHELRQKTKPDLWAQLKDLKSELALLRVLALNLIMTYLRSLYIVNDGLGLLLAMGVLGVAGNGLVVGLAWRKVTGRSWVWVSHSWVIGFVVEEDEATGKREGRTKGGYEREGGVDNGINEKDKGYCCPKNYKFVSRGLEQVIPRGKVEPKNG
ncbi:hypothetical protein DVH24_011930 [Malus domestica]|uniref:Uncharacterized protein n=1 Tax=Malus domestica TaxID=3750 RepID=A0A498JCN9_MALDO|nr:hypothetical protein DVH24_011930 [Malus domestica]